MLSSYLVKLVILCEYKLRFIITKCYIGVGHVVGKTKLLVIYASLASLSWLNYVFRWY